MRYRPDLVDASADQNIRLRTQQRPTHRILPPFDLVAAEKRVLEDMPPDLRQTRDNRLSIGLHGVQTFRLLSQHPLGHLVSRPEMCNVFTQRRLCVEWDNLVLSLGRPCNRFYESE